MGRPRLAATIELGSALIARQRAMAAVRAAKINELLETHVRRDDVARLWVAIVGRARLTLMDLVARIDARLPHLDEAARAAVRRLIDEALDEIPITDEERQLAARAPVAGEPRAVVAPVTTMAGARAQTARLQVRWLELQARIAAQP